jgi:hypothetical protein
MQRATVDGPWGTPQNLGPNINSAAVEQCPHLTPDGHTLMFASTRPGGVGGSDLYYTHRRNQRDDFGWDIPQNLGSGVNSSATEVTPGSFEDPNNGNIVLYFASTRPGGPGGLDIYSSVMRNDGNFGPAVFVQELSSSVADNFPAPRGDGLEMFLTSDRSGSLGGNDLWRSARPTTSANWSVPVNLGPLINTATGDLGTAIPLAQNILIFHSDRPGGQGGMDLQLTTRSKLGATGPAINVGGVVNATTYLTEALAPNSIISIFGTNLATVAVPGELAAGSFPTTLFGTKVNLGSISAQLLYVSPLQINALVPSAISPGNTNVFVTVDGIVSAPQSIIVSAP